MLIAIFAFIVVFSVVVVIHELGHYIAAKRAGIKVYEFSIGFPFSPRVATLFKRGETEFTLRLLPLGGFVSFSKDSSDGAEYLLAPASKRALIAISGPLFNMLFAFFIFILVFLFGKANYDVLLAFKAASATLWQITVGTLMVLTGGGGGFSSLAGPLGIASMAGDALLAGLMSFMFFTGVLSAGIGIMNLLPLPMLDGGQLVMLAIEKLIRRPVPERVYAAVMLTGITLFIVITVLVTWLDVQRLTA